MNGAAVGGRQMQQRPGGQLHHRQYSSDQLFSDGGNGGVASKWLQPGGLAASQQVEYSRMLRSMQRGMSGEFLISGEPLTPGLTSRSSSHRKNGEEVSPNELSPGILDLHSFDTELLPEMTGAGFDAAPFGYSRDRNMDDLETNFYSNRPLNRNIVAPEKEKTSSVAKIKVVVRKRPLNKKEIAKKEDDIITIEPSSNSLTVYETKLKVDLTEYLEKHEFVFDAVLDENVSNEEVYRETVEPIVPAIFQRTKATCFAYGQTGSGKTYTMQPLPLKASQDILRLMHHTYRNQGFHLFVSFFEIYGGKLFDLLNDRKKLCMREDGKQKVCIVGLQEYRVSSIETIKELIEKGNATRSTGTTGANEESSRSHAILQLAIKKSVDGNESKPARIAGKLSFIDLAGSERGADTTDNDKQTRIEGAEINKSLLALKECIRALDNDQVHIPFRGSKLTEVLRDSFVGDSRTVMISCISPNSGSCEHTLNTLRYADRVKSLSKGNSKKELSSASSNLNLRESVAGPTSLSRTEGNNADATENYKSGWSKQIERESSFSSGREEDLVTLSHTKHFRANSRSSSMAEVFDYSEVYEQDKPSWRKGKAEAHSSLPIDGRSTKRVDSLVKRKDGFDEDNNSFYSDDELTELLKEEEDLVTAHRRQVEETLNIVREEMRLLDEADQPGNQLDAYVSRLNAILSQKAAGIVNLQTRLTHFQRHLTEKHVLVSSLAP
ncbi:kinesin-like protein KIN-13B isoform X2 [Canna indica]|uniref:Kinesin-like protein n=1 Tax=Canna indica TaxID=4628 RepID=A0AAQ3K2G2_9LILI|nr:kinesin-like protein KIN-13B isoform X2 [Canna indica]